MLRAFAWKGRPQNDLYCVSWVLKPIHSLTDWYYEIDDCMEDNREDY